MGREWFYKATGSGGRKSSSKTINKNNVKYANTISSPGCMSAIYNMFDIQHHQFQLHRPSFVSESVITGIQAPRNSLESLEFVAPSSSELEVKEHTNFNIPMPAGRILIETKRSRFIDDLTLESCNSPGTKTPNLVARLMGLDLLPEYSSPRPSSSSTTTNSHHQSLSLPTTPRLSTTSRPSMENVNPNRLSVQVEKEICNGCRGHEHEHLHRRPTRCVPQSEHKINPEVDYRASQHAKEITIQIRERISQRHGAFGTDITNIMSPATNKYKRKDSNHYLLKGSSPVIETTIKAKRDKSASLSSSPRLRLLDIKNNLNKSTSKSHLLSIKEVKSKSVQTSKFHQTLSIKENLVKDDKTKRLIDERYDLRLKKMNQQEKMFVSKKKLTTLQDRDLNVKDKKKYVSNKKDMTSSSLTPKRLYQKQGSLSSNLNSSYNLNDTHSYYISRIQPSIFHHQLAVTTVFEAEVEGVVTEIESGIFETLVHEIVTTMSRVTLVVKEICN